MLDKCSRIDTVENLPHCGGHGNRAMPCSDQQGGWKNLLFSRFAATRLHEVRADLSFAHLRYDISR